MAVETLIYPADGVEFHSLLHVGAGDGKRPAILLFPEAFGLGDEAKDRSARLAADGYVVLACDLHGEGRLLSPSDDVRAAVGPLLGDRSRLRARARAAFDALTLRPEVDATRIAAIGFCLGGTIALELGRDGAALAAIAGFHCGLSNPAPADAANIAASVLVMIGANDPSITPADRAAFEDEMRATGIDWQLKVYGGVVHSYTAKAADALGRSEFARYDARADHRSWAEMRQLFAETIDT